MKQYLGLALLPVALLSTGCETILADSDLLDMFTCSVVPYYAGDCTDPEVKAKVAGVLTDGAVEAQINCKGIAFSPNFQKSVPLNFSASRLQDGACFSTVAVGAPAGAGFSPETGTALRPRSVSESETCLVGSFHGPLIESLTSVENGVITLESSHCVTGGTDTCTMSVVSSCTGDVSAF